MSTEKLFIRIILSCKGLLSSSGSEAPRLHDYCKNRHVSYRDFLHWTSTREISSGIVEIGRRKKRLQKEKACPVKQSLYCILCMLFPASAITVLNLTRFLPALPVIPTTRPDIGPAFAACVLPFPTG